MSQITAERVLPDLESGRSCHSGWVQANVLEQLKAEESIEIRGGWVKPSGVDLQEWRRRRERGPRPFEKAKSRQDRAREALPCSESRLVALLGIGKFGVRYILDVIGATRVGIVYEVDKIGRQRPRPLWGMATGATP